MLIVLDRSAFFGRICTKKQILSMATPTINMWPFFSSSCYLVVAYDRLADPCGSAFFVCAPVVVAMSGYLGTPLADICCFDKKSAYSLQKGLRLFGMDPVTGVLDGYHFASSKETGDFEG